MSKIGILTFHNNENKGAILQGYALYQALSRIFDLDVELVEYRTRAKEVSRRRGKFMSRRPWRIPRRIIDRRMMERFVETEFETSRSSIVTDDHEEAVAWLEAQGYDILVTGSDEVWKVQNDSGGGLRSRMRPSRPFPNLYLLDPDLSAMKAAYAASGNLTDLRTLSESQIATLERHLAAYDAISVRDSHSEQLLAELGIQDVHRVPDPTLLSDFPRADAESKLVEQGIDPEAPIVGFHAPDHPVFEDICDSYRERGFQIVTPTSSRFADVELTGVLYPFEYYSLYGSFDMVVTNSLHSTIFSLRHGIPFATIDIDDRYATLESKTYSLLRDFELLDRHLDAIDGDATEFHERREELERPPDRDHVDARIDDLRQSGFDFLQLVRERYEADD